MLSEPALRQEFLLLALKLAGPFDSTAMLQRTVYLAQKMSGLSQYGFKHPYGIYSEDLARDIDDLGMASKSISVPYPMYCDSRYAVKLSPGGQARLAGMEDSQMPGGMAAKVRDSFSKIKSMSKHDLVEKAYSEIHPHAVDRGNASNALRGLIPKVSAYYKKNRDRESEFVMAVLEVVEPYLEIDDKDLTPQQRMVILHLVYELAQRCSDIFDVLPADTEALEPKLVGLSEVEYLLRDYCHDKKIKDDVYRLPFDKAFTKEQIEMLAQGIEDLDIEQLCEEIKSKRVHG